MSAGYDYGNARIRAMLGRLLKVADYERLLNQRSVEAFIADMAETPYQPDLEAALRLESGIASLNTAFRRNLTQALQKIRSFYEGEPRDLITLLLHRWDRHNLLTILRGQSQEIAPEQILPNLVPVGRIDEISLRELVRQPGLRATLDLMQMWRLSYAAALAAPGAADLDRLELALNQAHYAALRRALDPDFAAESPPTTAVGGSRTVQTEAAPPKRRDANRALVWEEIQTAIDVANIGMVLRLLRRPELMALLERRYENGPSALLIDGGGITLHRLRRLLDQSATIETAIQGLANSRYGAALAAGWQRYQDPGGSFAAIERELQRFQIERAAALIDRAPLTIAAPLAYLARKEAEITNLQLAAQAAALNLPREQVRAELIIV
ncbi:MAG: V-type ATPase subunit [Caldilineaceae bacterium]